MYSGLDLAHRPDHDQACRHLGRPAATPGSHRSRLLRSKTVSQARSEPKVSSMILGHNYEYSGIYEK